MIGGGSEPMDLPDMWLVSQTDRVGAKSPIIRLFSLVATQP